MTLQGAGAEMHVPKGLRVSKVVARVGLDYAEGEHLVLNNASVRSLRWLWSQSGVQFGLSVSIC